MWHALSEYALKLHASGLGHDAVIEIMIALLGIMMATLSFIAVLFAILIAAFGFFGYKALEEQAILKADKTAARVAARSTKRVLDKFRLDDQGEAMARDQPPPEKKKPTAKKNSAVRRLNDASLKKKGDQNGTA